MGGVGQDLGYAVRMLRRNQGFTAIAVFTLALGIGANTAIFSVANVVFLHPLPYDQPGQLVLVSTIDRRSNQGGAQPADFLDWRAQNQVFELMVAKIDWPSYKLTDNNDPIEVVGSPVSAAFFPLLRVQPIVGRPFLESEDQPGAPGVVIISERLWETRYRRDPDILHRSIIIKGEPYTVVVSIVTAGLFGVAPAMQAASREVSEALKQQGARARRSWLRSSLIVAEVSLSLVLLTGAALLMTTFLRLIKTDPGLRTEHVLTLHVPAPDREMQRFERHAFYVELIRQVEAMAGVRAAAVTDYAPFTGTGYLHQ